MPYGIVEGRIHQYHVGGVGTQTDTCERLRLRCDIEDADPCREAVENRVSARQNGKGFVTLNQHQIDVVDPRRHREPGSAHTRSEIDDTITGPARRRGGEQHGVVAGAMA